MIINKNLVTNKEYKLFKPNHLFDDNKDQKGYEDWKSKQTDDNGYGLAVFRYAETWADLMETQLKVGFTVEEIADKTSHQADTEGITGFMYGMAVSILSLHWEYGEELKTWHNNKYEYKGDGVVNPAILTINKKGDNNIDR